MQESQASPDKPQGPKLSIKIIQTYSCFSAVMYLLPTDKGTQIFFVGGLNNLNNSTFFVLPIYPKCSHAVCRHKITKALVYIQFFHINWPNVALMLNFALHRYCYRSHRSLFQIIYVSDSSATEPTGLRERDVCGKKDVYNADSSLTWSCRCKKQRVQTASISLRMLPRYQRVKIADNEYLCSSGTGEDESNWVQRWSQLILKLNGSSQPPG